MTTATAKEPIVEERILYPYQKLWIEDKSRFKIALKSRQIGFSTIFALEGLLEAVELKRTVLFVSASERQSLELIIKVKKWINILEAVNLRANRKINLIQGTDKKTECELMGGGRVISLPANPKTIRGYTGSVYLDEFAFHERSDEIISATIPTITPGDLNLRIASTPAGEKGKFYETWKKENNYSKHRVDIYQANEQGVSADIDAIKEIIDDPDIFAQEFECVFLGDMAAYIPLELIHKCGAMSLEEINNLLGEITGEITVGVDVGRKKDLTAIVILEKRGDVHYVRVVEILDKITFQAQENFISAIIEKYKPYRLCIDETGLGMQLAENLSNRFTCVEGVTFTNASKETLAVNTKRLFENFTIRIPDDRHFKEDIHAIYKIVTTAGSIRYDATRYKGGHADRFWALALAIHALTSGPKAASSQAAPAKDAYKIKRKSAIYG